MSTIQFMCRTLLFRTSMRSCRSNYLKRFNNNIERSYLRCLSSGYNSSIRSFSKSTKRHAPDQDDHDDNTLKPLKLMSFREIIWGNPIQTIKNYWFAFLIRSYYDPTFTILGFLKGAEQAVEHVSNCIGRGNFNELEGLVDSQAIDEIKINYNFLDPRQQEIIPIDLRDIFVKFVYQVGMIFDDDSDRRFVEITTVFHGVQGMGDITQEALENFSTKELRKDYLHKTYICNYRFIKEITKGVDGDWIINKLNHFLPKDLSIRW